MLGLESELSGVRVWRAGPFSRLLLQEGIFKIQKILNSWTIFLKAKGLCGVFFVFLETNLGVMYKIYFSKGQIKEHKK